MGYKHSIDIKPPVHGRNTGWTWSYIDSARYCRFDPDDWSCRGYERNNERKNQGRDHERKRLPASSERSVQEIASPYPGWPRDDSSYRYYPVLFWIGTR